MRKVLIFILLLIPVTHVFSKTKKASANKNCCVSIVTPNANMIKIENARSALLNYSDNPIQKIKNTTATSFSFKIDPTFKLYLANAVTNKLKNIHLMIAQDGAADNSQLRLFLCGTDNKGIHIYMQQTVNPNPLILANYIFKNDGFYSTPHIPDVLVDTITFPENPNAEFNQKIDLNLAISMINDYNKLSIKDTSAYSLIFPADDFLNYINSAPDLDSVQFYLAKNRLSITFVIVGLNKAHKQILIRSDNNNYMLEFCTPCPYCVGAAGYYGRLEDPSKKGRKFKFNPYLSEKEYLKSEKNK